MGRRSSWHKYTVSGKNLDRQDLPTYKECRKVSESVRKLEQKIPGGKIKMVSKND